MRKTVILSFILAVSIFFSGCGIIYTEHSADTDIAEVTTEVPDTTSGDNLPEVYESDYEKEIAEFIKDLSGNTYGGDAFKIAVASEKYRMDADEKMSKIISDDLTERNEAVESLLDIELVYKQTNAATMADEIKAAVLADDYYADLVMLPEEKLGSFAVNGIVINLRSIPGINYDAEYYYKTSVSAACAGKSVYGLSGPATVHGEDLSCVFFNKSLAEKTGLENLYDLVEDGKWTVAEFVKYCNAASSLGDGYYSYSAQNTEPYLADLFYFGIGGTLVNSNIGYSPALSLAADGASDTVSLAASAVNAPGRYGNALDGIANFLAGKTLFLIERTSSMQSIVNASFDWGVLPMPKRDEKQEKYNSLAFCADTLFMCGVTTASDFDKCADVIAAENICSYGYCNDAYIKNSAYYYLRDNDSQKMLSKVTENPVYDFAYTFYTENDYIPNATFAAVRNAVSGVNSIENYMMYHSQGFYNAMYYLFDIN